MGSIILGIIFLLVCYIGIGLYHIWPYLLVGAGVSAAILVILYFALGKKKCPYCDREYRVFTNKVCPHCDDIDFKNIVTVDIVDCEETYRIEEERKIVSSYVMDGVEHVGYETVRHHIPNGYEYTFVIHYNNGSQETRVYHESSNFAQRLISINESSSSDFQKDVADSISRFVTALAKMAEQEEVDEEDETGVIKDIPLKDLSYLPIQDFVMLNIETTGSDNNYPTADFDEIISVSTFDENGNVLLDELCDTERKKTWDDAQKIHGISPDDVKGHPTFSDILEDVLQILADHHCVIAHDMVYVLGFIKGYINNKPDTIELCHKANWRLDVDSKEIYEFYENH